jgi:putative transposase
MDRRVTSEIFMPRRARITLAGVPLHLIQRGNNRQACFYSDDDCIHYLDWLGDHARSTGCRIHAHVLMTNHVHLLVSSDDAEAPGVMMKRLGQRYVQYINRTYRRSGSLWEGRYRSCLIRQEAWLLTCQRYIELNPVRAGMVEHPADYRWSSYRTHAQGEWNLLLTPHPLYLALADTAEARQHAYRELFRTHVEPGLIDQIRQATNGNFVLGNDRFAEEIRLALGRRVTPGKAGRPKKTAPPESGQLF